LGRESDRDYLPASQRVELKYDPSRVKKDVLYKPLLRIFRNSLKELINDVNDQFWNFN
jgi:hypothetical protein